MGLTDSDFKNLSSEDVRSRLEALSGKRKYAAMYSSLYGGVVTDPALMMVPIDDHLVHRGDGVFEAVRLVPSGFYLLREHLARLARSCDLIGLRLPWSAGDLEMVAERLRAVTGLTSGMLRIFVGRGPGDFSPSPYTTIGSQLYVILMEYTHLSEDKFNAGASLCFSKVAVKPGVFAQVKSCNYLQNVMTKKESLDRGFDFAVNLNADGYIAEGPTENILVLTAAGDLIAPRFDYTLRGTTLIRTLELARSAGLPGVREIGEGNVTVSALSSAREIMMVGTTLEVLGVTRLDVRGSDSAGASAVGDGRVGPVARALRALVRKDMGY